MTEAFIFYYFFGVIFYDLLPGPLQYIDEVFPWILLIYALFRRNFRIPVKLLVLFGIFLFYFIYSIAVNSNKISAICFDSIVQIKPFLAYYAVLFLSPNFSKAQRFYIRIALLCGAAIILVAGIGRIGKEVETVPGQLLSGARYSFAALFSGISYLFFSDRNKKDLFVSMAMILLGFCAPTSKFLGGVCLLPLTCVFMVDKLKKYRFICTVIISLICLPLLFYIVEDFNVYFESEDIARSALYITAGRIICDYFPLGSGFGSFGTSASANSYSDIYYQYDINGIYGLSESSVASGESFVSDAYIASLSEFGLAGLAIIIYFFITCVKRTGQDDKLFAVFIVLDLIVESFADSTIIGNRGVIVMMLLALCASNTRVNVKNDEVSENNR